VQLGWVELSGFDRTCAIYAASLGAAWAALILPAAPTAIFWFAGLLALPITLGTLIVLGLPLFFLFRKMGWTTWWQSAAAGALAGGISMAVLLGAVVAKVSGLAGWVGTVAFGAVPGAVGGWAFRAMLVRYGALESGTEAPEGYVYRPSPRPAAIILTVMTVADLSVWIWIRFGA